MNIELTVMQQPHDRWSYMACWADGDVLLSHIPTCWLDLMPLLVARKPLEQGYRLEDLLVVRLRGADYEMMRAPSGVVAATPLVNTAAPVTYPIHCPLKGEALR